MEKPWGSLGVGLLIVVREVKTPFTGWLSVNETWMVIGLPWAQFGTQLFVVTEPTPWAEVLAQFDQAIPVTNSSRLPPKSIVDGSRTCPPWEVANARSEARPADDGAGAGEAGAGAAATAAYGATWWLTIQSEYIMKSAYSNDPGTAFEPSPRGEARLALPGPSFT
jgi:hypothetical protein